MANLEPFGKQADLTKHRNKISANYQPHQLIVYTVKPQSNQLVDVYAPFHGPRTSRRVREQLGRGRRISIVGRSLSTRSFLALLVLRAVEAARDSLLTHFLLSPNLILALSEKKAQDTP